MPFQIAWLPAHPDEGSVSMQRYWHNLRREFPLAAGTEWRVAEALPPAGFTPRAGRLRRFWSKHLAYPAAVRGLGRADLYHLLDHSFAHVLGALPRDARIVATVHDLAPLDEPGHLSAAQLRRFRATVGCLRRATRLVADSRATARRLAQELQVPEADIAVLPLAVDHAQFSPRAPVRAGTYVLSVGGIDARKNLGALVLAMERAARDIPGLTLVRVGDALPAELRTALNAVLGGHVEERGWVEDHELAGLYAGALALLLPSRLEGFGLPVLEAMACGCPVVCSDASSLPEVGGAAALYFDPSDGAAAGAHLARLATEPARRAEAVAAGIEQASRFTWEAHARGLAAIYRETLAR